MNVAATEVLLSTPFWKFLFFFSTLERILTVIKVACFFEMTEKKHGNIRVEFRKF